MGCARHERLSVAGSSWAWTTRRRGHDVDLAALAAHLPALAQFAEQRNQQDVRALRRDPTCRDHVAVQWLVATGVEIRGLPGTTNLVLLCWRHHHDFAHHPQ
jgi:hypothetical protein